MIMLLIVPAFNKYQAKYMLIKDLDFQFLVKTNSSNSSYKHSSALGLQQSSPRKDKVPCSACSIEATTTKNNCPNNIQRQIKEGREEAKALMEVMDTMKYKGCCEKHYKKRNGAKLQILSVLSFF